MSSRSFQSHPLSCQTFQPQADMARRVRIRWNHFESAQSDSRRWCCLEILMEPWGVGVGSLFTDVCIITFSSDDAPSQTEAWLYSNTCFFECLKECTTSIINTCRFYDTHTWSWNINQVGVVFPFILSLSPLLKLQNVSLKISTVQSLTLRKDSAHNAGPPIRIIYVTQKHWLFVL